MKKRFSTKKNNLVEVIFDDPAEFDATREDSFLPAECKAVGWLEENNSSIVRITWLREEDDAPYVGLTVPRGCVKRLSPISYKGFLNKSRRKKN